jgi:phage repressor protein C with HTH and peptisase S24 domain
MTDNQRIESLLHALNFRSVRAFAVSLDVNPQIFYDIKAGKCGISRDLSRVILEKYSSINPEWLLYGEGEMLKTTTTISGDITVNGNGNTNIGHGQRNMPAVIEIKETGVEVECPNCGEVIEVTSTAVIPLVPPEVAKRPDINLESFRHNCPQQMEEVDLRQVWGKGVFLMKVDTRAMEPEYREGTFLVLRRLKDLSYARPDGSAYVIDTMRPHTLFRYLSKERDGTYVLSAESDKRGPIYLNAEDIINIYDVVGSFRIGR